MLPVLIVPLLFSLPAPDPRVDLEAFVRRTVTPALERDGVPGISVAILQDGELLLARGFGWADEGLGLPLLPGTPFPVGSLGRSLAGTAVLCEVERGALALDTQLGKLFPDAPPALQPITVQQLLEGRSGLPSASVLLARLAARESTQRPARKELFELLAALPAQGAPGERFAEDSTGWLLLPLLVEQAGQRSFADCLNQEICSPLGLHDTRARSELVVPLGHAADCRDVIEGSVPEVVSGLERYAAWAHVFSTPSDLVRWQAALFERTRLSESATRLLLESARSPTGESLGRNPYYVLGELGGQASWRHVGGIGGWRGALSWYGDSRLSICVLANCSSARVGLMEEEIARFLFRLPPREAQDLALESGESAALCGIYQLGTLRVRIFERDGRLWYESAAEETFRLRSQGFRQFLSPDGEVLLAFSGEEPLAQTFEETRKGSSSIARRMDAGH